MPLCQAAASRGVLGSGERGSLEPEMEAPRPSLAGGKQDPALGGGVGREATPTSWLGVTPLLGETQPHSRGLPFHKGQRSPSAATASPLVRKGALDGHGQPAPGSADSGRSVKISVSVNVQIPSQKIT